MLLVRISGHNTREAQRMLQPLVHVVPTFSRQATPCLVAIVPISEPLRAGEWHCGLTAQPDVAMRWLSLDTIHFSLFASLLLTGCDWERVDECRRANLDPLVSHAP